MLQVLSVRATTWTESEIQRLAKWCIERGYMVCLDVEYWTRLLALAIQTGRRQADGKARDKVSLTIYLHDKGVEPNDYDRQAAVAAICTELNERAGLGWLDELSASINGERSKQRAPKQRTAAEVKAALLG